MFDAEVWARVPFHFWSVVFFVFGCIVGSFLNVCIYRMPLGQSVVSPPSHCPHCNYSIPWYLNMPLVTWLYLRGKCANCRAPISPRYFLVELLTGVVFLVCWLLAGHQSAWLALIYCLFMAGLIVATFIDLEHFIIPDEITIGGIVVGFVCSIFVTGMHGEVELMSRAGKSILGIAVGGGLIYLVLRLGKLMFGRHHVALEPASKIIFTETMLVLPDGNIPYEEIFYRKSDVLKMDAGRVELCDRCYWNVPVEISLMSSLLKIGEEELKPEEVTHMEVTTDKLVVPREAMGLGDVKFMAAIGAFLGWQAVVFSLAVSSFIGAAVGVTIIALKKHERSGRIQYGPCIAAAAAIWVFGGYRWWQMLFPGR